MLNALRLSSIAASLLLVATTLPTTASATPVSNDNAGTWTDTYVDDNGVRTFAGTRYDAQGRRVTLASGETTGTFDTTPISPASFSSWGSLYLNASVPGDASVQVWVVSGTTVYGAGGATGTRAALPTPLSLVASDVSGYTLMTSLSGIATTATPLEILVRMNGPTVSPSVNGLRVTWTPRSVVSLRVEAPPSVQANQTIAYRVNVGVSFVDTSDLVVELPLPTPVTNVASARQDQTVTFQSATEGGTLSADGTKVIWRLGVRRAGETFTLIANLRTRMGTWNGTTYPTTTTANPGNGTPASFPVSTTVTSAPQLVLQRNYGAGIFFVNGNYHAFADSDVGFVFSGWNYRSPPSAGGETLFDPVVHDDVSNLIRQIGGKAVSGGPFDISHGGQFTATAITMPNGTVIPANSVYWTLNRLNVGEGFSFTYKIRTAKNVADGGPFVGGETMSDCVVFEADFVTQTTPRAGPQCAQFIIGVPTTPGWAFAKGERIREHVQVSAAEDLQPPMYPTTVKAAFGETIGYLLMTANGAVSELNDIIMIDKVPAGTIFEQAFLPPEANGTVWYYAEAGGSALPNDQPPNFDLATGALGAGWTQAMPSVAADVSWVAFRVPRLTSTYFPDTDPSDGTTPSSVIGEIVVTIAPPAGPCPANDVVLTNRGLFHIYAYTPQRGTKLAIAGGPARGVNDETTLVVPDLPNLGASWVSASPTVATANDPLIYTFSIVNNNPPAVRNPLDNALNTTVRIDIPSVTANGVPTRLLVDSLSAPDGTISYSLPTHITVTYPAAIAPTSTRTITLRTRMPSGVIDGTTFTMQARADYSDNICGNFQNTFSTSTRFFGVPALEVTKGGDYSNGQTGTEITWSLDYINPSPTPSTNSWLVDRIPAGVALSRVQIPQPGGQVWFSQTGAPTLPVQLDPNNPFTDTRIRTNFTRALDTDGDGWVQSPFGTATTYVAFLIDDTNLNPAQFITGTRRTVRLEATITETSLGAVIANQAGILSRELIQAISNKANFTVTGRPGLRMGKACAEVVAVGGTFTYTVDYYNDSANFDSGAEFTESLPAGLQILSVTHTWNARRLARTPNAAAPAITTSASGFTSSVGPLYPLEGGRFSVTVVATANLTSGTFLIPETSGIAYGEDDSTRAGYAACTVLVENADIYVRKLVDNPAPRAGETFNYTIVVANQGAHEAMDVVIRDRLPAQLELVAGSVVVTPSPWDLKANRTPTNLAGELVWSAGTNNGITQGTGTVGRLPGKSGDVSVIFGARVRPGVLPGTTIENCASASTSTGEDANFANNACVSVTTPLPDPWVMKTGPGLRKPGERVTWTLSYGNRANETAAGVVIIDSLPDGPIPAANGVVDVTYAGHIANHGEVVYFNTGSPGVAPAFNPSNPGANGWTTTLPTNAAITHVAFYAGDLPPLASPRNIQISANLIRPDGGLALPGSSFENCASVAMTTSGFRDGNTENNRGCATVRIPGVDLAVSATCDPSGAFPGVLPGGNMTFTMTVGNTGTVNAQGIKVRDTLPPELTLTIANAGIAVVTDASGQATNPVNEAGLPIAGGVAWSRADGWWYLGSLDENSPTWYRRVGLRPGDRTALVLPLEVGEQVPNRTVVVNQTTVGTDYGAAWTPDAGVEEILDNNSDSCQTSIYRADPLVIKKLENLSGDNTLAHVADTIRYTIEYNNAGDFPASGVVMEDRIPDGLVYISGSLGGVDPEQFDIQVSIDGGVSWVASTGVLSGRPDPSVTHVRVVAKGDVPAPAGNIFIQTTVVDFNRGTYDGTYGDLDIEGVLSYGENKCKRVTCELSGFECANGSYVPENECCPVCRPPVDGCDDGTPLEGGFVKEGIVGCYDGCNYNFSLWEYAPWGAAYERTVMCNESMHHRLLTYHSCLTEAVNPADCAHLPCGNAQGQACPASFRVQNTCAEGTACTGLAPWTCQAQTQGEVCTWVLGEAIKVWATCLELQNDVPAMNCNFFKAENNCTACQLDACNALDEGEKSWNHVWWWQTTDYIGGSLGQLLEQLGLRNESLPTGLVPGADLVAACSPGTPCGKGGNDANQCLVPCDDCDGKLCEIRICQICPNGAACAECLPDVIGLGRESSESTRELEIIDLFGAPSCQRLASIFSRYYTSCLGSFPPDQQWLCDAVKPPDCSAAQMCNEGTYTSPVFPNADERITKWERAIITEATRLTEDPDKGITYSVLDGTTGEPIDGYSNLPAPVDGSIDLSGISPDTHGSLQLEARFRGRNTGDFDMMKGYPLPEECYNRWYNNGEVYFEPIDINNDGLVAGNTYNDWNSYCTREPYVWHRDWEDPVVIDSEAVFGPSPDAYQRWTWTMGLNDEAEVVGYSGISRRSWDGTPEHPETYKYRAFYYSEDTGLVDVGEELADELGDIEVLSSGLGDINNDGIAAGLVTLAIPVAAADSCGAFGAIKHERVFNEIGFSDPNRITSNADAVHVVIGAKSYRLDRNLNVLGGPNEIGPAGNIGLARHPTTGQILSFSTATNPPKAAWFESDGITPVGGVFDIGGGNQITSAAVDSNGYFAAVVPALGYLAKFSPSFQLEGYWGFGGAVRVVTHDPHTDTFVFTTSTGDVIRFRAYSWGFNWEQSFTISVADGFQPNLIATAPNRVVYVGHRESGIVRAYDEDGALIGSVQLENEPASLHYDAVSKRLIVGYQNAGVGLVRSLCGAEAPVYATLPFTWSRLGGVNLLNLPDEDIDRRRINARAADPWHVRISSTGWVGTRYYKAGQNYHALRWNVGSGQYAMSENTINRGIVGVSNDGKVAIYGTEGVWDGENFNKVDLSTLGEESYEGAEWIYRMEEDGTLLGGVDVYREGATADDVFLGGSGAWVWAALVVEPDGRATALPTPEGANRGSEAFNRNSRGDVLTIHYYRDANRWSIGKTALWDGRQYLFVDGYDETLITETWANWYVWDGFRSLNDNREIAGHAYSSEKDIYVGDEIRQSFDRPYIWSPAKDDIVALLDWRVIYRTDRNPSFTLDTQVEGICANSITNTATVQTTTPQVSTANDRSSVSIDMNRADIEVAMTVDPAAVVSIPDQAEPWVNYTVSWTNRGPGVARGVRVVATLPEGVYEEGTWVVAENVTLEAGETGTWELSTQVWDTTPDTSLAGSVIASSSSLDCDAGNNVDSAAIYIGEWPNLYADVVSPANATVGTPFEVNIPWGNNGNATAASSVLRVTIPAGLTIVSSSATGNLLNGVFTTSLGNVAAGTNGTVTFVLTANNCASAGSDANIRATISTPSLELDTADNSGAATTTLVPPGGVLSLSANAGRGTVTAGDVITWTVNFANTGLRNTTDTVVVATVPMGTSVVPGSATNGAVAGNGTLSWNVGTLAPGQTGQVMFQTSTSSSTAATVAITATATASGACPASAGSNNVLVQSAGGLRLAKYADRPTVCHSPSNPAAGEIRWTLVVSNTGATNLACVAVNDTIPTGMTLVAGSLTTIGQPSTATGQPAWGCVTLAAGQSLSLGYTTRTSIQPSGLGTGTWATATSGTLSATSNAATVRYECNPTLAFAKAWGASCVLPGDPTTIALTVTNRSSEAVSNVEVVDPLPTGMTFVSSNFGSFDAQRNAFVATFARIAPGQTIVIEIAAAQSTATPSGTLLLNQAFLVAAGRTPMVSNMIGGATLACDDANVCTANGCDAFVGCVYRPVTNGLSCNDSDLCTTVDTCQNGACVGSAPVICEALSQCHSAGTCNPATGACSNPTLPTGTTCNDDNACTTGEFCNAGACGTGDAVNCDDGNACTTDSCNPATGCVNNNVVDGTTCDDNNLCSSNSECRAGACTATLYIACNDNNPCTVDACDPGVGCVARNAQNGLPCEDDNLCTLATVCQEGQCGGGDLVVCGPAGECEFDGVCNPATGVCDYAEKPGDIPVPLRLTNLGGNALSSAAHAISDSGLIAGTRQLSAGNDRAVIWAVDGSSTDVGPGVLHGINDAGQAAGIKDVGTGPIAFYSNGTTAVELWDVAASGAFAGPDANGSVAGDAKAANGPTVAMRLGSGTVAVLDDGAGGYAMASFANGRVVGTRDGGTNAAERAFSWDGGLTATILALPNGAVATRATAVSDAGHIGGSFDDNNGNQQASIWHPDGSTTIVAPACFDGDAGCLTDTTIIAIANDGTFLGEGLDANGNAFAFIGDDDGDPMVLGAAGAVSTRGVAMNDFGLVTGTWETAAGATYGFAYSDDIGLVDLTALGREVRPTAVTDSGFVLGHFTSLNGNVRAFLWSFERGAEDLGSLGGGVSLGHAINEAGVVVGHSLTATGASQAFVTTTPVFGCFACEEDNDPPTITCPVIPGVVECIDGGATIAIGTPSARDACSFPVTVTGGVEEAVGVGTTEITYTATDALGNEASCSLSVTVVDTTAPTVTCPEALEVTQEEGVCGATINDFAPTVTDGCDSNGVRVLSDAPATFGPGTTVVTFTAIDAAGNSATCQASVTVIDPTPLQIACDPDLRVVAPADFCGWPEAITAVVVSECTADITVTSASSSFPIGESTVTFDASNANGDEASCVTVLTVVDETAPTVACGGPIQLLEGDLPAAFVADAADACSATVAIATPTCWRVAADGTETEFTEGCATFVEGGTVVVGQVIADENADTPWTGEVVVRWTVTATDPSGNATTTACETDVERDRDGDGVADHSDNCVSTANADQSDVDDDGVGDVCDPVDDGIVALGSGCQGGSGGQDLAGLLALLLLGLVVRRMRVKSHN